MNSLQSIIILYQLSKQVLNNEHYRYKYVKNETWNVIGTYLIDALAVHYHFRNMVLMEKLSTTFHFLDQLWNHVRWYKPCDRHTAFTYVINQGCWWGVWQKIATGEHFPHFSKILQSVVDEVGFPFYWTVVARIILCW